jgi:oligoendopeptidase F
VQADRARADFAQLEPWETSANTYAALYAGVLERDWFLARARGYPSCLHAALHGNDIPTGVVERLISAARAGVGPVRRYHQLRRRALGLDRYGPYDTALPIVASDRRYPYDEAVAAVEASLAPLGEAWVADARAALRGRYIDVYETPGKRSGAYSAPVYGVHPYMLMNYNDTLDAVFTLAHELGHTMHTLLSHRSQPFVYAGYTIFVAEVPSTLSESLLLEHLLRLTADPRERIVLLQHAIDEIVGTFYTQAMFAEFELRAHQLVEQDQPITADVLGDLYLGILRDWNGDAVDFDARARSSWARVSHFFGTPFYVYQYATCFASSAQLVSALTQGSEADRAAAIDRYMTLLKAGGSDHPMQLLRRAGVDLSAPEPVEAVVRHMDELVTRLEAEWDALAG